LINLYDKFETDFAHNGLRVLNDTTSCLITEELNGSYDLDLEHAMDERGKWKDILEGNIIKADGQLFRIYHKSKILTSVKVNARHIFYDLLDNFLEDCRPTNLSGHSALDWVLTHTQYTHPFTSLGDVGGTNTKYYVRKNVVEAIMDEEGIINTWGGEIVRDNFEIKILGARGLDRGVLIAYGKNIQGIDETLDMSNMCTRAMVLGKDGLMLPEKYIDSPYINNFPHPIIKTIEFNDIDNIDALRAAGQNYFVESKCDIPQFNYVVSFLELSKTEEYKNYAILQRVYLGDTVTIKHSKLSMNLKAKVIKIVKNVLTGRIEKVELGSFIANIATTINNSAKEVKKEIIQVKSEYQKAIENATALITGSKGGNVVIKQNAEGQPCEILIMDTTDVNTCLKCWRWNLGGFGYSNTGVNGPFEVAITMDGTIMGKFITALIITGEQINGGTISGATIRTSNTSNYMLLHDQVLDLYKNNALNMRIGIDTYGADEYPFIAFGRGLDEPFNMQNYIWYADDDGTQETGYITIRAGKQTNLFSGGDVTINANNEIGIVAPLIRLSGETQITAPGGSGWFVDPWPAHACAIKTTGDVGIGGKLSATEGFKNLGKVFGAAWDCTIPDNTGVNLTHNLGYQPIITCSGTCGNIGLTFLDVDLNTIRVWVANNAGNAWVGRVSCW